MIADYGGQDRAAWLRKFNALERHREARAHAARLFRLGAKIIAAAIAVAGCMRAIGYF